MICTRCKKPYLSVASDRLSRASLFGLCEACGTTPRFGALASEFGFGATIFVLSAEFALLSWLFQGWRFFLVAVVSTLALYAAVVAIARSGEQVRFRNEGARRKGQWLQGLVGSALGLLLGIGWLWVAMTWGHSR